jgi:hypothetical protein
MAEEKMSRREKVVIAVLWTCVIIRILIEPSTGRIIRGHRG